MINLTLRLFGFPMNFLQIRVSDLEICIFIFLNVRPVVTNAIATATMIKLHVCNVGMVIYTMEIAF